jgi:hypothetical protein
MEIIECCESKMGEDPICIIYLLTSLTNIGNGFGWKLGSRACERGAVQIIRSFPGHSSQGICVQGHQTLLPFEGETRDGKLRRDDVRDERRVDLGLPVRAIEMIPIGVHKFTQT